MILDRVRSSCKAVAETATHVHIEENLVGDYAAALPLEEARVPDMHPERHYLGHGDDTVAFFLVLDSINFGSGWFPHLEKRAGMSGYFTVASCLTDHFREHGAPSARDLAQMTPADCCRIFGQDPGNATITPLLQLFARALNDLGRLITGSYGDCFTALVDRAGHSAERLVVLLAAMPLFRDVQEWRGREIHFFKRAQLTAADLAIAFEGQGPGRFTDLERLTIFADNLVPHVLRLDGVLRYERDLEQRIDAGSLIPAGSAQEIEIRACALHAVELMNASLRAHGHVLTAAGLDYLLWNRGQSPRYKQAKPRHRTRCAFY